MTQTIALTTLAQWIMNVFFSFDYSVLSAIHSFAQTGFGKILAPFLNLITLTGAKGAFLVAMCVVMMFFRKTRRTGICALLALTVGLLLANILAKPLVARPRPYDYSADIRAWWEYAGAHLEKDFSFPSGHMNACCAFCTAFVLTRGKRWLIPAVIYALLMGFSRMYLMVHYPSDVLGGLVFGICAGLIAFGIIRAVYHKWGETKFLREE